ncbi:MAG: VWA domain-containing protein [Lachnospiraceae bacterium]|nr:VWA domain-containing protein [Lachnospiraceae bacterium]
MKGKRIRRSKEEALPSEAAEEPTPVDETGTEPVAEEAATAGTEGQTEDFPESREAETEKQAVTTGAADGTGAALIANFASGSDTGTEGTRAEETLEDMEQTLNQVLEDISGQAQDQTTLAGRITYGPYTQDGVTLEVSADAGVLPEGAKLELSYPEGEMAGAELQSACDLIQAKLLNGGQSIAGMFLHRVRFVDGDGNEVRPNGSVEVKLSYAEPAVLEGSEAAELSDIRVYRIVNGGAMDLTEAGTAVLELTEAKGVGGITLTDSSFSDFAVVWTTPYKEAEIIPETVEVIGAGPLMPPVKGVAQTARKAARKASAQTDEEGSDDGLVMKKNATPNPNGDGTYTITLEAYTTGTVTVSKKSIPADIILVLDQSGSMAQEYVTLVTGETYTPITYNYEARQNSDSLYYKDGDSYQKVTVSYSRQVYICTYGTATRSTGRGDIYPPTERVTRLEALKRSVTSFEEAVAADAAENQVNHRIAVVGFADKGSGYGNTELFVGAKEYQCGDLARAHYGEALQDMSTGGKTNVLASIGALTGSGSTYPQYGLEMARGIFEAQSLTAGEERSRIVIFFSDGTPGYNASQYEEAEANAAIKKSRTLKKAVSEGGYGATVPP